MKKLYKYKTVSVIFVFILIIFLFPQNISKAEEYTIEGKTYTYTTEDDGSDGPDVEDLEFELTWYGGDGPGTTGSGVTSNDLTINEEWGWAEYEEDGIKFTVFAGATHEMLAANKGRTGKYWFYGAKFDHIHYFRYHQKFTFRFKDTARFGGETHNGIILDSGDFMMFPQEAMYHRVKGTQNALDTYLGADGSDRKGISGAYVVMSLDGNFVKNDNANQSANNGSIADFAINYLKDKISGFGDFLQKIMEETVTGKECKYLTYSNKEISSGIKTIESENDDGEKQTETITLDGQLMRDINGIDVSQMARESLRDMPNLGTNVKTIIDVDIPSKIDNIKGEEKKVFSTNTEIPAIQADAFSITNGSFDVFDINYIQEKNNSFANKKMWDLIRNFIITYSQIVNYCSALLLLTLLIYNGAIIVLSTFNGTPDKVKKAKETINSFLKAFLLITIIYVIIAIILYGYNAILKVLVSDEPSPFTTKAIVEETYSFNTNVTGYFKYMTLMDDALASLGYSIIYFIVVLLNFIYFILMIFRIWIIGAAIIIAPITAVNYMRGFNAKGGDKLTNLLYLKNWLSFFIRWTFFPIIMFVFYRWILLPIVNITI